MMSHLNILPFRKVVRLRPREGPEFCVICYNFEMAKLRIGPFSEMHFSKLEQKLCAAGIAFEKFEDPSYLAAYEQKMKQRSRMNEVIYPVYSGHSPEYLFIELEKSDIFHVRQDLNDLGYSLQDTSVQFSEEYYCPNCDYRAETQARCPKHNSLLLNYGDWLAARNKPTFTGRVAVFLIIIIFLGLIAAIISK